MQTPSVCPICDSSNSLNYVGNIVDAGRTNSQGMFIGMNMGADGGLIPGMQFSQSINGIAQRFTPPSRPGAITLPGFWILWLIWFPIATIAIRYWAVPIPDPDPIYWLIVTALFATFGAPLAFPLAFLTQVFIRLIRNRGYKHWLYAYNRLRNALYCSHDNVVFDYEIFGYPQDYIKHVFGEPPAKYALNYEGTQGA